MNGAAPGDKRGIAKVEGPAAGLDAGAVGDKQGPADDPDEKAAAVDSSIMCTSTAGIPMVP